MMWPFSFKSEYQRYNILEMDEDVKTPEQKFSGVELQIHPTDYYTCFFPIFVLEAPLQGGLAGLPKWEQRARTGVYIGHSPSHAG